MKPDVHILLFDPDRAFAHKARPALEQMGWRVSESRTHAGAEALASKDPVNVAIKTLAQARASHSLLERLRRSSPDSEFIILSPVADVPAAMEAVRRGAFDCLPLPCGADALIHSVSRALQHQLVAAEDPVLLSRIRALSPEDPLAGESHAMRRIREAVERVADTDVTLLLTGESGTGKEMIARSVHERSHRRAGPFVAVNCAALPDTMLESEFFGHVRGAFTGAVADKQGRFELARGGTLFLDEIGELSPLGQADLLRVLEDGIFRPLGSRTTVRADARIIAATNRDLDAACREGRFREDLLYRINVITFRLPPLRERPEDICRLAESFLLHFCARHRRPAKRLSADLLALLGKLEWRGNVRQLRNTIERMVLLAPERLLTSEQLPSHLQPTPGAGPAEAEELGPDLTLAEVESIWIRRTLAACHGNRSETARRLGIARRTLHAKLRQAAEEL